MIQRWLTHSIQWVANTSASSFGETWLSHTVSCVCVCVLVMLTVCTQGVCTEAGMYALRERRVHVTQEDFEMAVAKVK